MARPEEFRLYFYSGHKGRFGHEFLRFDIDDYGNLRYANQSNYRRDSIIRKSMRLSPALVGEIKRIIDDSEIMRETDQRWPEKDQEGRQTLEITMGGKSVFFETRKLGSLADIQRTDDPEGLRVFYYFVQDIKCLVLSLVALHFKIKPIA